MAVIPNGLPSQLQPLDVSFNKPIEAFMKEMWNQWMRVKNYELKCYLQRPTTPCVVNWL